MCVPPWKFVSLQPNFQGIWGLKFCHKYCVYVEEVGMEDVAFN